MSVSKSEVAVTSVSAEEPEEITGPVVVAVDVEDDDPYTA